MEVVYDLSAPVGNKVRSVKVKCQKCTVPTYYPISVNEYYRISIASWIGDGGNGYTIFREGRRNLM